MAQMGYQWGTNGVPMDNLKPFPHMLLFHTWYPLKVTKETSHEPSSHGAIFFGAGRAR